MAKVCSSDVMPLDGNLARTKAETSSGFAFSAFVAERVAPGGLIFAAAVRSPIDVLAPADLQHDRLEICPVGL